MNQHVPRVSIGLPVYNGENYLPQKLDAILAQTFTDFELIISDNASTDSTQKICLSYAAKDPRVRYYRNEVNLGLTKNLNRAFELSSPSEYFGWTAHDDLIAPDFYAKCVEVLDSDPSIILCHSWVKIIDERGEVVGDYDPFLYFADEGSPYPHKRFRDLIMIPHQCLDDLGLIRKSAITMEPIYEGHFGSDRNFLAELSLIGKFYHIPEYLFFWRDMRYRRDLPFDEWSARLDSSRPDRIPMPRWSMLYGYIRSVNRVELSAKERFLCYLQIAEWMTRHARGLAKDVVRGGEALARRSKKRVFARVSGSHASDQPAKATR
jgi:glycosyltransferase involved in cell wall biosynthesis